MPRQHAAERGSVARRRIRAVLASAVVAATLLSAAGCTGEPTLVADSSVSVAVSRGLTSVNDRSSFGNDPANREILQAVRSGFFFYDAAGRLVADESFGTVQVTAYDPFVVHYRVNPDARWSDETPVTAADLLLAWVAGSGALNTPGFDDRPYRDRTTGRYGEAFPPEVVYFDGPGNTGLEFSDGLPTVDDDGLGISIRFTRYLPDWRLLLEVGLPAHVVGARALPRAAGTLPADALVEAILQETATSLAALARVWNNDFDLAEVDLSDELLISNGPYRIEAYEADESITLRANEAYRGERSVHYERIRIWFMADPAEQLAGMREETIDVALPQASPESAAEAGELDGASIVATPSSNIEHVTLRVTNSRSGTFDDPVLREAFLLSVPRQEIAREFVIPIAPGQALPDSYTRMSGEGSFRLPGEDAARAAQLVAESGASSPTVCVLFDPASPRRQAEYQLIKTRAEQAGFRVTDCSTPGWLGLLDTPGGWDAALFAWDHRNTSTAAWEALFRTGGRGNVGFSGSPEADALLDRLVVTLDEAEREAVLDELDAVLWTSAIGLPLYHHPRLVVVRDGVTGVRPGPLSGVLWNVWEWAPASSER